MSLAFDENLRRGLASALRALEERLALARKLQMQAERERHDLLAENWRRKAAEFQKDLEVIHSAIRRMDDITVREVAGTAAQ